jgi:hypothetical protein
MEAPEFWEIYPQADRAKVEDLIRRLAEDLGMDEPPEVRESTVPLPANRVEVVASLDMIEPGWQGEGLIKPPSVSPQFTGTTEPVHESWWSSWGEPAGLLVLGIVALVAVILVVFLLLWIF